MGRNSYNIYIQLTNTNKITKKSLSTFKSFTSPLSYCIANILWLNKKPFDYFHDCSILKR